MEAPAVSTPPPCEGKMRANSTDTACLFLRQGSGCVARLSASSSCCALGSTNLTGTPRTFPGRKQAPCLPMLRKRLHQAHSPVENRRHVAAFLSLCAPALPFTSAARAAAIWLSQRLLCLTCSAMATALQRSRKYLKLTKYQFLVSSPTPSLVSDVASLLCAGIICPGVAPPVRVPH